MSKRSLFTTLTPLPPGISRETVMETLRSHTEMIDLNPLVEERHPIKPPPNATAEEYHCIWYSLTDKVQYLPGGLASGKVTYTCCFHDLENGLQTHCYAPMGLNIKGKWTLGGSLPGEPVAPVELGLGAPLTGLWLREDVDMKCNIMMTSFVKKTLKKAHSKLVDRLLVKAQIVDASLKNQEIFQGSQASTDYATSISENSVSDDGNNAPFSNPAGYQAQSPASSSVGSFRPLELSNFGDKNSGLGLYPAALAPNNRSSFISNPRASYQPQENPYPGNGQQAYNPRVSWQSLQQNPARSPSMHSVDAAHALSNPYRASCQQPPLPPLPQEQQQMRFAAELHSEEKVDSWRGSQNSTSLPPPARRTPQILEPGYNPSGQQSFGPVELE